MTEQKGVDTLYNAIISLSKTKEFENMEFYFAGSGEQEHYFKELSQNFKNCHFLGFQTDVVRLYQDSDIVVVPSRWESYCYSVAEAASCGVPVISSDIPGPNKLIIKNKTGILVKPDDFNRFSVSILKMYGIWSNKFKAFTLMGFRAREHISKNFEENMINKKLEKFISKNEK